MNNPLKTLPEFASEQEEQRFWESHDSSDYLDWSQAQRVVLPNLKPSTKTISQHLLDLIKVVADRHGNV